MGTGVNYLNNFKSLKEQDLNNSYGIYFLNSTDNILNLKKLINLKQLNYLNNNNSPKLIIDQNNGFNTNTEFLKSYEPNNYINLPNSNFFESNGTYLNTEGIFKANIKFL